MGRLIDADALIEAMKKTESEYENAMTCPSWWSAFNVISEQSTAYDIDKVVEELETMSQLITFKDMFKVHENIKMVATDIATQIVKHGVVADDVCGSIADKIKVTSLEVIVTGKREKPYYEIKYKEVGEIDYKIGYSSYDLNNVFAWRDEFFEIVNHK